MGWLIFTTIFIFMICLHKRNTLGKLIKNRVSESFIVKQSPVENIKLSNEQSALLTCSKVPIEIYSLPERPVLVSPYCSNILKSTAIKKLSYVLLPA